jgi:hypothetical protein
LLTNESVLRDFRQKLGLKPSEPFPHFEILLRTQIGITQYRDLSSSRTALIRNSSSLLRVFARITDSRLLIPSMATGTRVGPAVDDLPGDYSRVSALSDARLHVWDKCNMRWEASLAGVFQAKPKPMNLAYAHQPD